MFLEVFKCQDELMKFLSSIFSHLVRENACRKLIKILFLQFKMRPQLQLITTPTFQVILY